EMESQARAALIYLQSLRTGKAANLSDYEFTLEEAIENTKDELADAKKGAFPEVNARKPPSEFPSSPPPSASSPPSKSGAGKSGSGKSGADQGSTEEGPPRKNRRSSGNQ